MTEDEDEISVFRGEDIQINETIQDDDGNALDLRQANKVELTAALEQSLNPSYDEGKELFSVDGTNLDQNGNATFTLTSTETTQSPGLYSYQITVVLPDKEYTAVTGDLFIKQDIS